RRIQVGRIAMTDNTPQQPPKPETDQQQEMPRDSVEQVRSESVPQAAREQSLGQGPQRSKAAEAADLRRVRFGLAGCAAILLAVISCCVVHFDSSGSKSISPEAWYSANTPNSGDVMGVDNGGGHKEQRGSGGQMQQAGGQAPKLEKDTIER